MSVKNPILTHNVFIGLDDGGVKDQFAVLLNPGLAAAGLGVGAGTTSSAGPTVAAPTFSESITTLARETRSVFASTNKNLLTFEHSYNFDGQNSEPKFKIKVLDLDDNLITQFLKLGISADTSVSSPTGSPPVFKPKITPVWIAYGTGSDSEDWVGPMDGYLTEIELSYDANLLRSYELTIMALPLTGRSTQMIGGGYEITSKMYFDEIQKNQFHRSIENLFVEYIKANLGPDVQAIILLPNMNEYLGSIFRTLERVLVTYLNQVYATQGLSQLIDIKKEVMRDILGALGFMGGESNTTSPPNAGLRGPGGIPNPSIPPKVGGQPGFIQTPGAAQRDDVPAEVEADVSKITQRINRQSYNDIATQNNSLSYLTGSPGTLGITVDFLSSDWRTTTYHSTIAIKIEEGQENEDPREFFAKFVKNLDNLIADYKVNLGYTYETDNALKTFWEANGIIADPSKPVLIVGDQKLISNYLYGDLSIYKNLKDEIVAARGSIDPTTEKELLESIDLTVTLIDGTTTHLESIKIPKDVDNSSFEHVYKKITSEEYQEDIYSLLHPGARGNSLSISRGAGVGVAGVSEFNTVGTKAALELAIQGITVEFLAGYPGSNIISFEQDISKYLLANLFKVARSAAEKEFFNT